MTFDVDYERGWHVGAHKPDMCPGPGGCDAVRYLDEIARLRAGLAWYATASPDDLADDQGTHARAVLKGGE